MRDTVRRLTEPGTASCAALSLAAGAAVFAALVLAGAFYAFLAALAVGAGAVLYRRRSGR